MFPPNSCVAKLSLLGAALVALTARGQTHVVTATDRPSLQGALLAAQQATNEKLQSLRQSGMNAVVIELAGIRPAGRQRENAAAKRVHQSKLDLYYWIEVARCPELADAHPEWMASLQGHSQWRRLFADAPHPKDNEVIKNYPWVPILNSEAFTAQQDRIRQLLEDRPKPKGVFLNDLQGAPSACGCGNTLCRWTTDYGPIRTATKLGADAAARFVDSIRERIPGVSVIPVWTTECEEHDGAQDGACAGVGCFHGICWKAYSDQLEPVARQNGQLGVLMPYVAFGRDLPIYGERASWIQHAVGTFQAMPPRHNRESVPASKLIAILQGWDVTQDQITAQIRIARASGVADYVVALAKIRQDWEPRVFAWK